MEMAGLRIQAGDSGGSTRAGLWSGERKQEKFQGSPDGLTTIPPTAWLSSHRCVTCWSISVTKSYSTVWSLLQPLQSATWTSSRPTRGTATAPL